MCYIGGLTLNIANSLCGKYSRAKEGVEETKLAFDGITARLEAPLVEEWKAQECMAMEQHGDSLSIYEVVLEKGMKMLCFFINEPLMYCSTNTVRNTFKAGRSQGPPRKPIWCCGHSHGWPQS